MAARRARPSTRESLWLGALIGAAFATRSQEVLFALLPALLVLGGPAPWGERVSRALRLAGWAFVGALPWLLLQALHSYLLFSRYAFNLLGQGGYLHPFESRWLEHAVLVVARALLVDAVAYIAAVGTVAYLRREWRWAVSGLVVLFLTAWVNGATQDWAAGWSFGGRRFASALVLLTPGLALVIEVRGAPAARRPRTGARAGAVVEPPADGAIHDRHAAEGRTGELRPARAPAE